MIGVVIVLKQMRYLSIVIMDLDRLRAFARVPMARMGLSTSGFVAAGHFVAYTFLEPFVRNVLALRSNGVALVLVAYTDAGVVGSFAGERLAVRNVRRAFGRAAGALALCVIAALATSGSPRGAILMVVAGGVAFGAVPVCIQTWMHQSSPTLYEAGSALTVSVFQTSLAAGAVLDGLLVDVADIRAAFLVRALAAGLGAASAPAVQSSCASTVPCGPEIEGDTQ